MQIFFLCFLCFNFNYFHTFVLHPNKYKDVIGFLKHFIKLLTHVHFHLLYLYICFNGFYFELPN